MGWTLWQWSSRYDRWDWITECQVEARKVEVLRGYRRRNPRGTKFRWKLSSEGAPKRFRGRSK